MSLPQNDHRLNATLLFKLLFLALVGLLLACSDSNGAADTGDGPTDTGASDSDVQQDIVEDTGPRLCTPGTRRCVSEAAAEQCDDDNEWIRSDCAEDEICFGGDCGALGTCEPLEVTSCVSYSRYEGCNEVGTGLGEFEVPFNLTCVNQDDVDQMIPRTCLSGETDCQDEEVLLRCAESGLEFEFSTNCMEDDETTICDDNACITLCQYIEKRDTYVGCEYWAVDLDNAFLPAEGDAFFAQFAVAISNPSEILTAEVQIRRLDSILSNGTVGPGQMVVFQLPPADINGTMIGFEAVQVTSSVPVVAYQFNPLTNEQVYSNDASLLMPTSSLGTEYYIMSRRQTFDDLKGYLTIIATQDGETDVTVTLPALTGENPLITLAGTDVPPLEGGESFSVTLHQFEVFNLETNRNGADLTGAYIESTRPVAVFAGSEAANAPNYDNCIFRQTQQDWVCEFDRETPCFDEGRQAPNIEMCSTFISCCADHLEQQMLPLFAWGRTFALGRSSPRGDEPDVWRVLASTNNTEITLVGVTPWEEDPNEPVRREYTLNEGEWFEFVSWSDFEVLSTQPIMIGQFLAAENSPNPDDEPNPFEHPNDANIGDPAFMTAVPTEQFREDYIFLVPGQYEQNFITVVSPVGTVFTHRDQGGSETLGLDLSEVFGAGDWQVMRYALTREGYHRLTSGDGARFGVMVHGYDQYVSYGYPAGLDIAAINTR